MKNIRFKKLMMICTVSMTVLVAVGRIDAAAAADLLPLPQAIPMSNALDAAIRAKWEQSRSSGPVRTEHVNADGSAKYANRLILEASPYLNQHAHNPVNWFPWGQEAFDVAKATNRPVIVSIGYSSCHWCHVMEEESYDDLKIAEFLNKNFVSIKVDRETHPDVDAIYLLAVQVMGSSGGWPLHAFLTPGGKPYLGMTYLPPQEFMTALEAVVETWSDDQHGLIELADKITSVIESFEDHQLVDVEIGQTQIEQIIEVLARIEAEADGFAPAQSSFPNEAELLMLLDWAARDRNARALKLAENRLRSMAFGGIHDHVGGGFHRYTIDGEWMIPHFEKMLYTQAHIARAYIYAYQITADPVYLRVAENTLDYVLRDMTAENGLFFSSRDADSGGQEGTYYVWSLDEIREAVGDDFELIVRHYSATESGNFDIGNVLYIENPIEDNAEHFGLSEDEYLSQVKQATEKMRAYRNNRKKPFRDEKSITTWNAAFITTLTQASALISQKPYLQAALRAGHQLWETSVDENETLYRIVLNDVRAERGKLKDYAYFIQALVALYDASGDPVWLHRAEKLADKMVALFWDQQRGGFFSVAVDDAQALIVRQKDRFDDALPAANAVAALALSRLYKRNGNQLYARYTQSTFSVFAAEIFSIPSSFPYTLKAQQEHDHGPVFAREHIAWGNATADIRVTGVFADSLKAVIEIDLGQGWHIQAHEVTDQSLTPTAVTAATDDWTLTDVHYPPAKSLTIESLDFPLSVWSGAVQIPIELSGQVTPTTMPVIALELQGCNDEVCLFPEQIVLEIPYSDVTG